MWMQKKLWREKQNTKTKNLDPRKVTGPGCTPILTLNIEGGLYKGFAYHW